MGLIFNGARLHEQLVAAGIPIITVRVIGESSGTIVYAPEATSEQMVQGQAILDAFDWSDSAFDSWFNVSQRTDALSRLNSPDGFAKLVRACALVLLDEVNTLRTNAGLATRTAAQMKTAIQNKLNGGTAD